MEFINQLLRPLLAVAAILVLAYWFSRRLGRSFGVGRNREGRRLKMLEQMPCGQDQRLILVEWEENQFLIGAGPSGFALLARKEKCDIQEQTDIQEGENQDG